MYDKLIERASKPKAVMAICAVTALIVIAIWIAL